MFKKWSVKTLIKEGKTSDKHKHWYRKIFIIKIKITSKHKKENESWLNQKHKVHERTSVVYQPRPKS